MNIIAQAESVLSDGPCTHVEQDNGFLSTAYVHVEPYYGIQQVSKEMLCNS